MGLSLCQRKRIPRHHESDSHTNQEKPAVRRKRNQNNHHHCDGNNQSRRPLKDALALPG